MNITLCDAICELLSDGVPRSRLDIEKDLCVKGIYPELDYLLHVEDIQKFVRKGIWHYSPDPYQERIIWVTNKSNEVIGCHLPYNFNLARAKRGGNWILTTF